MVSWPPGAPSCRARTAPLANCSQATSSSAVARGGDGRRLAVRAWRGPRPGVAASTRSENTLDTASTIAGYPAADGLVDVR